MCHWRASSLLFMSNGCNVLALFIKLVSRAHHNESRLLRMSLIDRDEADVANRMASLVKVL